MRLPNGHYPDEVLDLPAGPYAVTCRCGFTTPLQTELRHAIARYAMHVAEAEVPRTTFALGEPYAPRTS